MSRSSPSVSVVIPTFNRARVLSRALSSVLAQTFQDFEVHVIDDGSTDETRRMVGEFSDPRINTVALPVQGGAAAARNKGIEQARGKYVAFLDSDDEYLPSFLEVLVGYMEEATSDEAAVLPSYWVPSVDGATREVRRLSSLQYWELLRFRQATKPFVVARTEALRGVWFDPLLVSYQEWDLFMRLLRDQQIVALDTPQVIVHDEGDDVKVTSARKHIEALGYLSRKYAASLSGDTFAQRQWHMKLVRLHMAVGQVQQARSQARHAALSYPRHAPTWGLFLPASINNRVFTWAWNAYRIQSVCGRRVADAARGRRWQTRLAWREKGST